MSKLKRLLVSACFETAKGKRRCSRNRGHEICKGDRCLVIKENMAKNNYCMESAQLILEKAKEDINGVFLELDGND